MAGQEGIQHDDLLNLLLNYFDEESGAPISRELLRDEVTTMFMAGHETTAQTLSWMLYQLALNKDVNIKVREEGIEVIGNRLPDYEDISKLKYTRQVVHETLRCYPAFYALARKTLGNDNLLGIHIGPGTNVLLNLYGLHRHPAFWKNPDRFDPTHFDPEVDAKRQPYVFLPFGGGPRLCLGSNFAMMVMQVVISRMASQFSFDVPDGFIPEIEPNISLRAKGGIWLHIRKVQN
jgi:cytochrome P450